MWGSADLFWPFIPYRFNSGSDFYYNFAFKPTIEAEANIQVGPWVGLDITAFGLTLFGTGAFAGVYATAEGLIEPTGLMGFARGEGVYGSFDDWQVEASAEVGAFFTVSAEVLWLEFDIFDWRWPFLVWEDGVAL